MFKLNQTRFTKFEIVPIHRNRSIELKIKIDININVSGAIPGAVMVAAPIFAKAAWVGFKAAAEIVEEELEARRSCQRPAAAQP